jgi:3-phosphoshikimate 1-carboxyvinyltransferase
VADLIIRADRGFLKSFPSHLGGAIIPNVIDEIPILAVLGTQLPGGLTVADAGELRKKESDRIHALVYNLRSVGVDAQESADGFVIPFTPRIAGGPVQAFGDHRIAMAFAILGLMTENGVEIDEPECAAVSFPGFFDSLHALAVR